LSGTASIVSVNPLCTNVKAVVVWLPAASAAVMVMTFVPGYSGRFSSQNFPPALHFIYQIAFLQGILTLLEGGPVS